MNPTAFVLDSAEPAHIQEALIDGVGEGEAAFGITPGGHFDAAGSKQAAGALGSERRDGAALAGHHICPGLFQGLGDETGFDGHILFEFEFDAVAVPAAEQRILGDYVDGNQVKSGKQIALASRTSVRNDI